MEANELMIGDWVLDKKTNRPYKIIGTNDLLFHDDYSHIPLTAEILEKNGFGYKEEDDNNLTHYYLGHECYLDNPDLHIGTYSNKGVYWLNYCNDAIHGIKYVHQLQHALRLCNIDKKIEL